MRFNGITLMLPDNADHMVTDQMHRTIDIPDRPMRIISLVPSQTELLHDLGLGERVVGITKFCVHPEEWFRTKTRVGGTKKLDLEKIRQLKPDLIIGNKEENTREDIEALQQEFPVWMSDVRDLSGALEMIQAVGALTGTGETARDLAARIEASFAQLRPLEEPRTVAYLIWQEPYMAAGQGTFINDMLQRCGLVNVFDEGDARYPQIRDMELAHAGPELVLLSSEPYPFKEEHVHEVRLLLPEVPVLLVDGEPFSWYGSRLLHTAAYLQQLCERL
jgi:ABC-type Fe3+-hydroxamate transport system substrate-binding protein